MALPLTPPTWDSAKGTSEGKLTTWLAASTRQLLRRVEALEKQISRESAAHIAEPHEEARRITPLVAPALYAPPSDPAGGDPPRRHSRVRAGCGCPCAQGNATGAHH